MIVNRNTNPEKDLYYLGGKVIELLDTSSDTKFDYFKLYQLLNTQKSISMNLYCFVLDWLFILGVIKNSDNGMIEKCF